VSDSPAVDDRYDPDANGARGYELAIRAMREMRIRGGEIEASTPREWEWQREGMVPVSMLDTVK
jgi:hypothetical protein